jgi:hypothetical protein
MKVHQVKAVLKSITSSDNRVYIDGTEIRNVTYFACAVGLGKAGKVTITFHADVDLELLGAVGDVEGVEAAPTEQSEP